MKKLIYGFAMLAILSAGCSKDAYEDSIIQSQQLQKTEIKKVSIEEVPFLQPFVEKFNARRATSKSYEDLQLDLDNILKYASKTGYESYNIAIIENFSDKEDYYFETLHVVKTEEEYKSYKAKYNPEDDSKAFDMMTFTGKIELSDIEGLKKKIIEFENGNEKEDADPVNNDPANRGSIWDWLWCLFADCWNGLGDETNPSHNWYDGSDYSGTGSYGGHVVIIYPSHVGGIPSGGTNQNPANGNHGGGVTTVANESWPLNASQVVKANLITGRLGLSSEARIWLRMTANAPSTNALYWYLMEKDATDKEAKKFASEAVDAFMNGGSVNFANEIIIDATFKNNQKANCVLQKLLNQNMGNKFKDMLLGTFGSSDRSNIKFMVRNLPATSTGTFDAVTVGSSSILTQNKSMFYVILDQNFVNNASTIEIAMTLMHELIHAELLQRCIELGIITEMAFNANFDGVLVFQNGPTFSGDQHSQMLAMLIQRYLNYSKPSQWNHNLMTDQAYNTVIAENTADVYPLLNDPSNDFLNNINTDPANPYGTFTLEKAMEFLAWTGLEGTQAYSNNVANNPTDLSGVNYISGASRTKFTQVCQ